MKLEKNLVVVIVVIVLLIIVVWAAVMAARNQPSRSRARHSAQSSRRAKVNTGNQQHKFLVEADCPAATGTIIADVSIEDPCYTFTCEASVNIHSIVIDKVLIEPEGTLIAPFEDLPLLTPGSDVTCPQDAENPPGDPFVTSIVDQGASFQQDWLIFTNNGAIPTADTGPSTGPWYFEKEPFSSSNKTVITCGCRENFDPTSLKDDEQFAPRQPSESILDLTFDASLLDPTIAQVALNIDIGFSSEANYDFARILVDGVGAFSGSGPGFSSADPYRTSNVNIVVPIGSTVRFSFNKDPAVYGGNDTMYFVINKATPVAALEFPTTLVLTCGGNVIKDYTDLVDLDGPATSLTIDCNIELATGCQLCLTADPNVYSQYNVTATYQNIPQIYDHVYDETFRGEVDLNAIKYNNRYPKDLSIIGGWYNSDDQLAENLAFFSEVSGCPNGGPRQLIFKKYSLASSGPYYVNSYWSLGASEIWIEIGSNIWQSDANNRIWVFDPVVGDFRIDETVPDNLPGYGYTGSTVYAPVRNTDERYWQYEMDLTDPDHEFNPPTVFFDFVGQYYKSGFLASQFGVKSKESWPTINPLGIDQTQLQASFGVGTKAQYDDLFAKLQNNGIKRKYGIQRFVYWPYPVKGNGNQKIHPQLSSSQRDKLAWVINLNRYGYLAFVPQLIDEIEGEHNYPKLCPGETIKLKGTGTRLDGFPLRLAMDGYHTGPKPGPDFMQTYSGRDPRNGKKIPSSQSYNIHKEWAYYTIRLPITIDNTNDTIYSRNGGITRFGLVEGLQLEIKSKNINLGPYLTVPSISGQSPIVDKLEGKIVLADPLDASTAFVNAAQLKGNVVLVMFEAGVTLSSSVVATNALAAGAVGVIFVDAGGLIEPDFANQSFTANAAITSIQIGTLAGDAIVTAIQAGDTLYADVTNDLPYLKYKLPHGTHYLVDLLQDMYDAYVAGEVEFYVELGNFITAFDPASAPNLYGANDEFVFGGTGKALLYGPDDKKHQSNFFGPTGLDVAYLWETKKPLISQLEFISLEFFDGIFTKLYPGQYKTHTPLTAKECDLLIDAVNNKRTRVSAKHGPVTHDMPYDNFVACIQELSMMKGTEDHNVITPWAMKAEDGLYELPRNMEDLLRRLKTVVLDPTFTYVAPSNDIDPYEDGGAPGTAPIEGVPISATWAPAIYCIALRLTGAGHSGEYSEMYNAGYMRQHSENQARGEGRLEWIVPRLDQTLYYHPSTVLPVIGDVSGRRVEIPIVNYLEDPRWLITGIMGPGPVAGAPDYSSVPYRLHTGTDYQALEPTDVKYPDAVAGDWLFGVVKDSKARSILGLKANQTPPRIGYITWYTSAFSSQGNSALSTWNDPDFPKADTAALTAAARILQYFNQRGVQHIIVDVRNTVGGGENFWKSFASLVGDDRFYNDTGAEAIMTLEPNGVQYVRADVNFQVQREILGEATYLFRDTVLNCWPSALVAGGIEAVIPGATWNGEVTGQAAVGRKSNILWISNATSISNPQFQLLDIKATSLDKETYNGDFGKSTQFIHYGIYDRPFSTSGNYESQLNWHGKGRAGEEENPVGLMMAIDRWEASRSAYLDGAIDGEGGVLKGLDQEFGDLHRPHIKGNMNATVYWGDIGYTIGNKGVDEETDGVPYVPPRYKDVVFGQPLTYRDSTLERCIQMVCDPDVESHFYQDDGYGYVTAKPQ